MSDPAILEHALAYAAMGWQVFPVEPRGKRPLGRLAPHGFKDATGDPEVIREWCRQAPDMNIGIRCGAASGIAVIDLDKYKPGYDDSIEDLALPNTALALTPGGGEHHIFRYPQGHHIASRTNVLPGVDVKGEGGYIVAPPSIHPSGGQYVWEVEHDPIDGAEMAVLPLLPLFVGNGRAADMRKTDTDAPVTEADVHKIVECLSKLGSEYAGDYKRWLEIGMACHSVDASARMFAQWDRWSQQSSKYDSATCRQKWDTFQREGNHGGRIGLGTLIRWAGVSGGSPDRVSIEWPDPEPLPDELPPVMAFDSKLLPGSFRPWIDDIAERIQCPPDFPAAGAMVGLAGVVGRRIGIRPKRQDDWLVTPNLWGNIIGRPGIMKSPAIQESLKPLRRLEIAAKEQFDAAQNEYEATKLVAAQHKKVVEGQIRKAITEARDPDVIAQGLLANTVEAPTRKRYVVNDTTIEKLGELLRDNPNGVTVLRDELIGFLRSLDREGQEGARAFYLEAWNGCGRYTYDRIGRGTIDIEAATVSIIGGIQPGPLRQYLRAAVDSGAGDDGLMQRFQVAVWPDVSRSWRNVDRWPDTQAKNRAYSVFERLDALDPHTIGASFDRDDPDAIPFLRFGPFAQDAFDAWRSDLERKIRSGREHPAMEAHLSKYRSLIPSLALLIHLADNVDGGAIGLPPLEAAIGWGTYLETHARRIFAVAVTPDIAAARALADKITGGQVQDPFSLRDIYRREWASLATRDDVSEAVEILADLGWLWETKERTGGPVRIRYRINPKIAIPVSGPANAGLAGLAGTREGGPEFFEGADDSSETLEREAIMAVESEQTRDSR